MFDVCEGKIQSLQVGAGGQHRIDDGIAESRLAQFQGV